MVKCNKLKILKIVLLLFCYKIYSQDIHYSQYFRIPALINPSTTCNFTDNWRISLNYRNQWKRIGIPFNTSSAIFEKPFKIGGEPIGFGFSFINDNTGVNGINTNKIYLSASYEFNQSINKIRAGLQVGLVNRNINSKNLTFPEDWNIEEGTFIPSGEFQDHKSYLDLSLGVLWSTRIKNYEPEIGMSIAHINMPNSSFLNEKYKLPIKYTIIAQNKYILEEFFYIKPGVILMKQRSASLSIINLTGGYMLNRRTSSLKEINLSLMYRSSNIIESDAVILSGGMRIRKIDFAISYDLYISTIKKFTNNINALEFVIIYNNFTTLLNVFTIPCERL